MPAADAIPPAPRPREIIHCARCGEENLAGATCCHACEAHLYLACPACGQRCLRALKQCAQCGARMGSSRWNRIKSRIFRWCTPWEALGGLVVLAALIVLLVQLVLSLGSTVAQPPEEPDSDPATPRGGAAKPSADTAPVPPED